MDINKEQTDDLTAVVRIKIEKDDYESRVDEVLADYRKKARMDGFRPGKVPAGLIKRMYGTSVRAEEINKILSESLSKYLVDNKMNILGEPLPRDEETSGIDWENDTEFEFGFEMGLAPEIELNLSKKDKVPFYRIKVEEKMIDDTQENYAKRFGTVEPAEQIEGNEILKGDLRQVDEKGNLVEEGITAEDTSFTMEVIKDDKTKADLTGRKAGDSVVMDVKKALPNDTELASVLKIDKSRVAEIFPHFSFDIKEISRFQPAEINQDLFDKAFGEGKVSSMDEFRNLIVKEIEANLDKEGEYRLVIDIREHLLKKLKFDLPSDFLKRWLKEINKEKLDEEQIEKEYPGFEKDLKWQLIKDRIVKDHHIEVTEQEVMAGAREFTRMQFMQYGLADVPDEHLDNYSNELLKKEEEKNKIVEKIREDKVIATLKELISVEDKKISVEKFNKLYEKNN